MDIRLYGRKREEEEEEGERERERERTNFPIIFDPWYITNTRPERGGGGAKHSHRVIERSLLEF